MRLAVDQRDVDVDERPVAADAALRPASRMPFSTLPWNWLGTVPPTIRCSKTMPEPGGPGSASTTTTAYCPCPPDCLTCRPVTRAGAGEGLDHGHPDRHGGDARRRAGCAAVRAAPRRAPPPRTRAAAGRCRAGARAARWGPRRPAGPAPWPAGPRRPGTRPRPRPAAAGWAGPRAGPAAGPPARTACRRSRRWRAGRRRRCRRPGRTATGRSARAQRRGDRADPLVDVVVGVAALGHAVAGDVDRDVGPQRAGEDPHQRDPAEVGVGRRLHDLGDQRAVGVAGQRAAPGRRRAG